LQWLAAARRAPWPMSDFRRTWPTTDFHRTRPCGPDLGQGGLDLGQGGLDLGLAGPSGLLPALEVMCGVCRRSPSCSTGGVLRVGRDPTVWPTCGPRLFGEWAIWDDLREARTSGRRLRIVNSLGCVDLYYPGLAWCVHHGVWCHGWCVPCRRLVVGGGGRCSGLMPRTSFGLVPTMTAPSGIATPSWGHRHHRSPRLSWYLWVKTQTPLEWAVAASTSLSF
jgi:hypothetical protein